jgi:hypothetical protein
MSASSGKVAISMNTTPLSGSAPTGTQVRDLVGFGSANGFEGAGPATGGSSTTAILRIDGGCSDGDNNGTDFVSGDPQPRNSSSDGTACHDVVISQVYGGGGNAGAPYANDYVELYNRSSTSVDLTGWSVQYAAATGSAWSLTPLSGSILAGGYYLVEEASGGSFGVSLPRPDSIGNVNVGSTAGKVALVSNSWGLSGNGPSGTGVRDFLGYGSASAFEGAAPAPAPSNGTADARVRQGCTDTDDNSSDFRVAPPVPRNTATTARTCGGSPPATGATSDFDGDGTTDIAVFRPSTGGWFVKGAPSMFWGASGDVPVPGDYDGDGTTDIAVFRPSSGMWFVKGAPSASWGTSGDVPVPGDYDGDGRTDIAVFRPSSGMWFVDGGPTTGWGANGDRPTPLPSAIGQAFFP